MVIYELIGCGNMKYTSDCWNHVDVFFLSPERNCFTSFDVKIGSK